MLGKLSKNHDVRVAMNQYIQSHQYRTFASLFPLIALADMDGVRC